MWFFIFSGLIAFTGTSASSSCPVELIPPSAVVPFGSSLSANCTSLSNQTESMGWESSRGGVSLKERVTYVNFTIDAILDWLFEPKCFINYDEGKQCLEKLVITAYKLPDSVSMSPAGPMIEDKAYSFRCDIAKVAPAKSLAVHWHIGNEIFHTETFDDLSITPVNVSSAVNLMARRDHNERGIWCEAKLDFGPTGPAPPSIQSKSQKAIVLYPPTFINPENEKVEIASDSKITLNCTATGNPQPDFSWHFPHEIQKTNQKQNMNVPTMTPSFELPGIYNCTASNSQGTRTKSFNVVQAQSNRTVFGALLGGFVTLAVLLFIGGFFFVTPEGTFSFCKGSYIRGQPTSSAPI